MPECISPEAARFGMAAWFAIGAVISGALVGWLVSVSSRTRGPLEAPPPPTLCTHDGPCPEGPPYDGSHVVPHSSVTGRWN